MRAPFKSFLIRPLWCLSFICLVDLSTSRSLAQEALFSNLQNQESVDQRNFQVQNQFGLGREPDLNFFLSPNTSIAYNDNVNISPTDQDHDWLWNSGLNLGWIWTGKQNQVVTLSTGASYLHYIREKRDNRFNITPGSNLSYDHYWDRTRLNLHNNFSYSTDPTQTGEISGQSQFGGYNNAAGVTINHSIGPVLLNANYDHVNFISTESASNRNTRSSENAVLSSLFQILPYLSAGPEFSASWTRYEEGILNDSLNLSYGVAANLDVTPTLRLQARTGLTEFDFESTGSLPDPGTQSSVYFSLNLYHEITERLRQTLELGRSSRLGILSDITESDFLNYSLNWRIFNDFSTSLNASVNDSTQDSLLINESFRMYNASIGFNYRINDTYSTALTHRFALRESDLGNRNYTQNMITLSFNAIF